MTDHDAIAARVRQDRETGTPGPWVQDDMTPAWINMHDCNGTWNVATAHMCCGYPVSGSDANARRVSHSSRRINAFTSTCTSRHGNERPASRHANPCVNRSNSMASLCLA